MKIMCGLGLIYILILIMHPRTYSGGGDRHARQPPISGAVVPVRLMALIMTIFFSELISTKITPLLISLPYNKSQLKYIYIHSH